ncbi:MAG: FmdB family zinc ribbon protein [Chloroflexota bacterium]
MPVYSYRCESCGVQFERHQSFSDSPLKRCPECNKNSLRKVIGPVGVVFKGSGFYATDHRSPSGMKSSSTKSESSESKPSAENKPAAAESKTE